MATRATALNGRQRMLYPYVLPERSIFGTLGNFLFLLLVLLKWFPVPLSRTS
jgi:hypothetical protein